MEKMEKAAMAAYLKDVENDMQDLTAASILENKRMKAETSKVEANPNKMPPASAETNPRFQNSVNRNFTYNMVSCDQEGKEKPAFHPKGNPKAGVQGKKNKKQKSKTSQEENKGLVKRQWYEAQSPEGYSYYWNIETNETSWEVPEEGFMTISEQEEEAREQKIQEELLKQLEVEEAKEKADILVEQKASAEREKLKEIKKLREEKVEEEEEKIPYRRDYSVPEKPQPYGSWTTVKLIETKPVDLQLPAKKEAIVVPLLKSEHPPPSKREFHEKKVERIITGSDEEGEVPSTFKKRKFGNKNVRKRLED